MQEDYMAADGGESSDAGGSGPQQRRCALAEPQEGAFPPVAARLTLRDFKVCM